MPIDLICMLVLAFGFWQGYQRGIIQVAFNVIAYIFGVTLAFKMTPATTTFLEKTSDSNNPLLFLGGFIVNLVIIMVLVRYAAKGLEGLFELAYMGTINQVLGGAAYSAFFILIFSILLWFCDKAGMVTDDTKAVSRTYVYLEKLPVNAKNLVVRFQPVFAEIWQTSITWMGKMEKYGPKDKDAKPKVYDIDEDGNRSPSSSKGVDDFPEARKPRNREITPIYDDDGIEGN